MYLLQLNENKWENKIFQLLQGKMNTYASRNLLFDNAPTRGKVDFFTAGVVKSLLIGSVEEEWAGIPDVDGDNWGVLCEVSSGYGGWYWSETMNGFLSNGCEWLQMLNFDQYTSRGSVVGGINIALLSEVGGNYKTLKMSD